MVAERARMGWERERVRLGDGSVRESRGWERERVRDGMGERERE